MVSKLCKGRSIKRPQKAKSQKEKYKTSGEAKESRIKKMGMFPSADRMGKGAKGMKKIILFIFIISLLILTGCTSQPEKPDGPVSRTAVIVLGNYETTIEAREYKRISSGWIVVFGIDGTIYRTNEKNVLFIDKEIK